MNRRTYLGALSLAGVVGSAGCFDVFRRDETATPSPSSTASPPVTSPRPTDTPDLRERFDSIVDMAVDVGVDREGREPIDAALQSAVADDTLLAFPPGTYRVAEGALVAFARNFGIVGTGDDRSAVRFVHPEGFSDRFINVRDGRDVLLRNFTIDQTADEVTNSGIVVLNDDGARIEDVEVAGFTPARSQGTPDLNIHITTPNGRGVVRRFVTKGGGRVGVYPASYPGIYSGPQHSGTLELVDCHVEECGSNGVYASRTNGGVQITGGLFKNNDVAQVRICGEGSFIRNARIVVDTADTTDTRGTYDTVRGLWWESGWMGKTGGYVENCDFALGSAANPRALLQIDGTAGSVTVRNSRFTFDTRDQRYWGVYAAAPGVSNMGGRPSKPWAITLENVTFTGRTGDGAAAEIVTRPNTVLADVTVDQRGTSDGVVLRTPTGARIDRGSFVAGRYPIQVAFQAGSGPCPVRLAAIDTVRTRRRDLQALATLIEGDGRETCVGSGLFRRDSFALTGRCDAGYFAVPLGEDGTASTPATRYTGTGEC